MAQGRGARSDNANIDKTFRSVVAESQPEPRDNSGQEPHKTKSNASFMAGIAHPLLALYDLVAGPPMTQRDRHRRAIGEANVRSNAGLSWFNRTTW
jgi:hypothetical protein